jgi:hypothetical protein
MAVKTSPAVVPLHTVDDGGAAERYMGEIYRMQDSLRFSGFAQALAGAENVYIVHRHGVTTVVARTCDIPHRYRLGIAGFRLTQYARAGFVDVERVFADALYCEPMDTWNSDDWHVVCVDTDSGELLGYVELAGNGGQDEPIQNNPHRQPFPVEQVHGIDLFEIVEAAPDFTTTNVREIKRMVHNSSIDDRRIRYRLSIELILGLQWVMAETTPVVRALVGDAEAHVALRHIATAGLSPTVVTGTTPRLPEGHLLRPRYERRALVEPFYGEVPDIAELHYRRGVAESVVADANVMAHLRKLVAEDMKTRITRVSVMSEYNAEAV